jgi:hypothetical protein
LHARGARFDDPVVGHRLIPASIVSRQRLQVPTKSESNKLDSWELKTVIEADRSFHSTSAPLVEKIVGGSIPYRKQGNIML